MQAERTALTPAVVKREIRKIVAHNGHKLGRFDRYGADCIYCQAMMVLTDATEHVATGADTLGSFNEQCCGDDPAAQAIHRVIWAARALRAGEGFTCCSPCGVIVARSNTGRLWVGQYDGWVQGWWREDAETVIREHIAVLLDWTKCGYAASDRRRGLDYDLSHTFRVEGVGRKQVTIRA